MLFGFFSVFFFSVPHTKCFTSQEVLHSVTSDVWATVHEISCVDNIFSGCFDLEVQASIYSLVLWLLTSAGSDS